MNLTVEYMKNTGQTYLLTVHINSYSKEDPDHTSDASDWDAEGDEWLDFTVTKTLYYFDLVGVDADYRSEFSEDEFDEIYVIVLKAYKEQIEGEYNEYL